MMRKKLLVILLTALLSLTIIVVFRTKLLAQSSPTPAACFVYGVQDYNAEDSQFLRIDVANKKAYALGPVYSSFDFESITVDPDTRLLITAQPGTGRLFYIDSQNGKLFPLVTTNLHDISGLTFHPLSKELWAIDKVKGIYTIDKLTGATTLMYAYNSSLTPHNEVEGIAWRENGSELFVTREDNELWRYQPSNNSFSLIKKDPFPAASDDIVMRPDGLLMVALQNTRNNDMSVINYNPNSLRIDSTAVVSPVFYDIEGLTWPSYCGTPEDITPNTPVPTLFVTPRPTRIPTGNAAIEGIVYVDLNKNRIKDSTEDLYEGASITITGAAVANVVTDDNGEYAATGLPNGSYTVTINLPEYYMPTTSRTVSITVTADTIVNFGIIPNISVAGSVFIDTNGNNIKDGTEITYAGPITITSTAGIVSYSGGTFTIRNVAPGSQTIAYTSIPAGHITGYPKNGPPPSYLVVVGDGCTVDATTGAYCTSNGSIKDLKYAIRDSAPWIQTTGMDIRIDNGFYNLVPANPVCGTGAYTSINGSSNTPGIIFTGDQPSFHGKGQPSQTGWIVGGSTYPEVFLKTGSELPTSYGFLLAKIQGSGAQIVDIQSLNTCRNLSNCTLPNTISGRGIVYHAKGDTVLNGYTFPPNKNVIVLIDGSLTLNGNLRVPKGSSAVFSAGQDIIINETVGYEPSCTSGNNSIEGLFSADRHFIVEGINNCSQGIDRMLQIQGGVVVNASARNGTFQNNRDLCQLNAQYPVITFSERIDFLLNAPEVIRRKSTFYKEVAP